VRDGQVILQIKLTNAMVSSVSAGFSQNGLSEQVSLNFTKISWEYTPAQDANGSTGSPKVTASYDLTTMKAL
jgi:type VI protein secretion system component Hcp